MILRILNGIMTVLFLISCAVQLNDPDPLTWIAVYGFCAILSFLAMIGILTPLAPVSLVVMLPWFLVLMPKELGPWLQIETAREAGGLLICIVWMVVLTIAWLRRRKAKAAKSESPS